MPTVVAPPVATPVDPQAVFTRASMRLKAGDPAGAVALVTPLPREQETALFHGLTELALEQDPADAARLSLLQPAGGARETAISRVVRVWFARAPEAALGWVYALRDPAARIIALGSVAAEIVATNPRAGLERIRGGGRAGTAPPGSAELTRVVLAHWARRDGEAALEWTATLPEAEQLPAVTTIGFEVAQFRPERALRIAEVLPEGRDRRLLVAELAQTWIARDPTGADTWVKSLPAGTTRDAALAGFSAATGPVRTRGRAGETIAPGVGAKVATQGQPRADDLRREFERRLQESPSTAAAWLESLPPPDVTDEMLRRVAQEWLRFDPAAAATWLHLHVPSPSRRDQIWREVLP